MNYSADELAALRLLLEAEVAFAARRRRADKEMVDRLELKNSVGFENSAGEPQIRFRRGRIA
jgi:hypothetical protein